MFIPTLLLTLRVFYTYCHFVSINLCKKVKPSRVGGIGRINAIDDFRTLFWKIGEIIIFLLLPSLFFLEGNENEKGKYRKCYILIGLGEL